MKRLQPKTLSLFKLISDCKDTGESHKDQVSSTIKKCGATNLRRFLIFKKIPPQMLAIVDHATVF